MNLRILILILISQIINFKRVYRKLDEDKDPNDKLSFENLKKYFEDINNIYKDKYKKNSNLSTYDKILTLLKENKEKFYEIYIIENSNIKNVLDIIEDLKYFLNEYYKKNENFSYAKIDYFLETDYKIILDKTFKGNKVLIKDRVKLFINKLNLIFLFLTKIELGQTLNLHKLFSWYIDLILDILESLNIQLQFKGKEFLIKITNSQKFDNNLNLKDEEIKSLNNYKANKSDFYNGCKFINNEFISYYHGYYSDLNSNRKFKIMIQNNVDNSRYDLKRLDVFKFSKIFLAYTSYKWFSLFGKYYLDCFIFLVNSKIKT